MSSAPGLTWFAHLSVLRATAAKSAASHGQRCGNAAAGDPKAALIPLDTAAPGVAYTVHEIDYPGTGADWPQRLEELGFLPGERVMVKARAFPGGDPLSVRVGHSTFALRRAEAACVRVRPWPAEPR
jgi:ferrous iron transport protein A